MKQTIDDAKKNVNQSQDEIKSTESIIETVPKKKDNKLN